MAPGPVWTGAGNLASSGIQSPDHPARSQSLYLLSYPAHKLINAAEKTILCTERNVMNSQIMVSVLVTFLQSCCLCYVSYYTEKKTLQEKEVLLTLCLEFWCEELNIFHFEFMTVHSHKSSTAC